MTFPTTGILDNFTGSNGVSPPNANWTNVYNGIAIQSNQVTGSVDADWNLSGWSAGTFGPACECYCTINLKPIESRPVTLLSRMTTLSIASLCCYTISFRVESGVDTVVVERTDNAVGTQLGATSYQELTAGCSVGVEVAGNVITPMYKAPAGSWAPLTDAIRSDSTYPNAGYTGLLFADTTVRVDNYGGGTIPPGITAHTNMFLVF